MVDVVNEGFDASREAVPANVKAQRLLLYRNELRAYEAMLRAHHEGALKAPDQRQAGTRNIKRYDAETEHDLVHAQATAYDSQHAVREVSGRVPGMLTELDELLGIKSTPAFPGPGAGVAEWMTLVKKMAKWVGDHYDNAVGQRALNFAAAPW